MARRASQLEPGQGWPVAHRNAPAGRFRRGRQGCARMCERGLMDKDPDTRASFACLVAREKAHRCDRSRRLRIELVQHARNLTPTSEPASQLALCRISHATEEDADIVSAVASELEASPI